MFLEKTCCLGSSSCVFVSWSRHLELFMVFLDIDIYSHIFLDGFLILWFLLSWSERFEVSRILLGFQYWDHSGFWGSGIDPISEWSSFWNIGFRLQAIPWCSGALGKVIVSQADQGDWLWKSLKHDSGSTSMEGDRGITRSILGLDIDGRVNFLFPPFCGYWSNSGSQTFGTSTFAFWDILFELWNFKMCAVGSYKGKK